MRRVDIVIHTGIALAAAVKVEVGDLPCVQVDVFDVHAEALQLLHASDLVTCCEELYQPAVDELAWLIISGVGNLSLEVEVVPELEVCVSFEGLGELLEDWL
jgi:hypothetical protein